MAEQQDSRRRAPIAVFDSGLGGLTVVRAIRQRLPAEDVVYFGDTARVPYGTKSAETVTRFTRQICAFLTQLEPKVIIAACNTASATALSTIRGECAIPILDVIEPCVRAALTSRRNDIVAVLGTAATIGSCAFERLIHRLRPDVRVVQQSCPLFVPLVEEGRVAGDAITRLAINEYLGPVRRLRPRAVLLGCTHYPVLRPDLQDYFGPGVALIDSGTAVADALATLLHESDQLAAGERGVLHCYVSDDPQRFAAIGGRFAGEPLAHVIRVPAEAWAASEGAVPEVVDAWSAGCPPEFPPIHSAAQSSRRQRSDATRV